MTSTRLQRKRSERGASLILLVSIIGLAFIVTIAAFLGAAANSQDTARVASAKVDIATREDVLIREILQQTATGMLPGTNGVTGPILNWTTIMTNAVNNLRATSYVDPVELAALPGLNGVIPANMGDTYGTLLGIFQGYNREVPFGGTSGVANLLPTYNGAVQPPLMNWSANATLSATTAANTPQEFFLGSVNTAGTPLTQSSGNRWAQITYPNIRFGYKRPGDLFVARRVWWRIPVAYQTAQQTVEDQAGVNRFPSASVNYVLSVYEIPSQLPISANATLQIGQYADGTSWGNKVQITGSIYADQIQLYGGTYNGGISSRRQVNVVSQATVAGETYSDSTFDNLGTREQRDLTRLVGAAPVSVAGNDGKVLLARVMPGDDFYMAAPNDTPTNWDLYARPYYKCGVRIIINSYDDPINNLVYTSAGTTPGNISVTVQSRANIGGSPDAVLGVPTNASGWASVTYSQGTGTPAGSAFDSQNFMQYTSTNTGVANEDRNILLIDLSKVASSLGIPAGQLYSVYIGANPTAAPSPATDIGVALIGGGNLSAFTNGLSIVTKQRLYLIDPFDSQVSPGGTSIYAPEVRYGISAISPQVNLTGQVAVVAGSTAVNPLSFKSGNGNQIGSSVTAATLSEVTDPTQIPPITVLNLLFTIEKERTN
jgi:hypothetical protein